MTRNVRTLFQPRVEGLEGRCLPTTVNLLGGQLRITGTPAADTITVRNIDGQVRIDGLEQGFAADAVQSIVVNAEAGKDLIRLDSHAVPGQKPLAMPAWVYGEGGSDTVV